MDDCAVLEFDRDRLVGAFHEKPMRLVSVLCRTAELRTRSLVVICIAYLTSFMAAFR